MPKKNSNKFDLSTEYGVLVNRYLSMTEDYILSIERLSKKNKHFFNSEDEKTEQEHKEMYLYHDKINNTINASFTYAFSIFEIFLKRVLSNEIKTNKTIKERYFGKWDRLVDEKEHIKYGVSSKILRNEIKQFENYDVLIRNEKSTLIEFMSSLFGIKKPKEKTFFSGYIAYYNLAREVRNTLTHRGDTFDQKLIDSLERNSALKKNPEYLQRFYKNHMEDNNQKKKLIKVNTKSLLGKTIRIDFVKTISSLIFLSAWFVMNLSKTKDDMGSPLADQYNDINVFVHKHECKHLLEMSAKLFRTYAKYICDDDIEKVQDVDIFNFLLGSDLHRELSIRSFNRFVRRMPKDLPKEKANEIKKLNSKFKKEITLDKRKTIEDFFKFTVLDKKYQNLLKANLENDLKSFLKYTKLIKPTKLEMEDWFVFKKYFNNKEFQSYYKKVKG